MLDLVIAPDPIYKTICAPVAEVNDSVRAQLDGMMATLDYFDALGLGAPMVGLTTRLVVIALNDESGKNHRYKMVNPAITQRSADMVTTNEGSITFLGIEAPVTRAAEITVTYLDETGAKQSLSATGLLAICIQHEIDYLDGKTILDYQPPMKRDILERKMKKQKRTGPIPHVHGAHCNH